MSLVEELKPQLAELAGRYPENRRTAALLPALHLVQERAGYLPEEELRELGSYFGIPLATVLGVVSFYPMFYREPRGKYHISLCRTLSCEICGNEGVRKAIRDRLGIGPGETTADGLWSLSWAECLGACDAAPAMKINDTYYDRVTPEKASAILDGILAREGRS